MLIRIFLHLMGWRRRSTNIAVITGAPLLSLYGCASYFSTMEEQSKGFIPSHLVDDLRPKTAPDSAQKPLALPPMSYGTNARPPFKDEITLVADLPEKYYVPASAAPDSRTKRLVIVGDVHGQLGALKKLLKKVGFDKQNGRDHLILVGDLITKGPDSAGVVQLAMDLGASAVRGNHEDRALLLYAAHTKHLNHANEVNDLQKLEKSLKHSLAVARSLTDAQRSWLSSLPVILRIGPLPTPTTSSSPPPWDAAGELLVVHGGLVPDVPLAKQDRWAVMNMRSLSYPVDDTLWLKVKQRLEKESAERADEHNKPIIEEEKLAKAEGRKPKNLGVQKVEAVRITDDMVDAEVDRMRIMSQGQGQLDHHPEEDRDSNGAVVLVPNDGRAGEPWSHTWNRHQNALLPSSSSATAKRRTVVVYGHDAKAGLQAEPVAVDIYAPPGGMKASSRHKDMSKKFVMDVEEEEEELEEGDQERVDGEGVDEDLKEERMQRQRKIAKKTGEKGVRYAFGLDSGAGKGGRLTAMVVELRRADNGEDVVMKHEIVQVKVTE